jgi:hypothetical protein
VQDNKYKEAIKYYEPLVKAKIDNLLSITAIVLANLCVSYIMTSQVAITPCHMLYTMMMCCVSEVSFPEFDLRLAALCAAPSTEWHIAMLLLVTIHRHLQSHLYARHVACAQCIVHRCCHPAVCNMCTTQISYGAPLEVCAQTPSSGVPMHTLYCAAMHCYANVHISIYFCCALPTLCAIHCSSVLLAGILYVNPLQCAICRALRFACM